jgi:uncharacterized protein (UPF0147 family)
MNRKIIINNAQVVNNRGAEQISKELKAKTKAPNMMAATIIKVIAQVNILK